MSGRLPNRSVIVIGAASCAGAPDPGCAAGPDALHHYAVFHDTPLQHLAWDAILRVPPMPRQAAIIAVSALNRKLAEKVHGVLDEGNFPLVVGGDHSCAIGTWSGAQRALADRGALGLIWIDAHMDSHTFDTTQSGQLHGMPLASLLGHGHAALRAFGPPLPDLRPGDLCLIGVRSYEAGEAALLHQLGVRVYTMDEVRARGLTTVFEEALARVRAHTAGFGVSVDLDALDPEEEPGVGSPVPGGIRCAALAAALARLRGDPDFIAMEIVEYNPYRDRDRATADAAGAFVEAVTPLAPKPAAD